MRRRSIGTPLTIGIVLALLLVALAVGWQVLVWSDRTPTLPVDSGLDSWDWTLMVLGMIFFVLVLIGLVWLCAWLVREMRVNQSQRAFLDAVTHEMKTPLAAFRLYLDTLSRHDLSASKRAEFLNHMREDLDRLDGTVDQVLAAARADERSGRARRDRVPIQSILDACIADLRDRQRLPEGAVQLWGAEGKVVQGHRNELELIFRNLLENAVKYSGDPADVRVGVTETPDGRVRVEIADRGIGIPRGELRKIFQRFYRAGRDVQRKAVGLGLGLFIVGSLVRRQGGRVVALSEGAGQGSRFVVTLRAAKPATAAHRSTSRTGAAASSAAATGSGRS